MTRTTSISLQNRIDEIRDQEITRLERQLELARQKAAQQAGPENEFWRVDDDLKREYERLKDDIKDAKGEASTLEHYRDRYSEGDGDATWTITELSAREFNEIGEEAISQSDIQMDARTEQVNLSPEMGGGKIRAIEASIIDAPPNAPEKPNGDPDVGEYPNTIQQFLYDCTDEFNATGEVDLGNSSLAADLMNSDDS